MVQYERQTSKIKGWFIYEEGWVFVLGHLSPMVFFHCPILKCFFCDALTSPSSLKKKILMCGFK